MMLIITVYVLVTWVGFVFIEAEIARLTKRIKEIEEQTSRNVSTAALASATNTAWLNKRIKNIERYRP